MTAEIGNTEVVKTDILVGLDACDRLVIRTGAALYIHGWAFSSDANIEALHVECNGIRYSTTFPIRRPGLDAAKGAWINAASIFPQAPYAQDLSLDTDAPYDFGFVSSAIALESAGDETVEVAIIARVCGQEQRLLTRQIQILKSDPKRDFFNHGMLGAFKQPINFQTNRLIPIANHAPVFLIGKKLSTQQIAHALEERGVVVSKPEQFAQMLATIQTCYDVYCECDFLYFNALRGQFNDYGISKFDIYALINKIIVHFHEHALQNGARHIFSLSDACDLDLVPLLKTIYPTSVFIHLEEDRQSPVIGENGLANEDDFARKIHILRNGNAPIHFRDMILDALCESTSISHVVNEILQCGMLQEQNANALLNSKSAGTKSIIESRKDGDDSYLQALPIFAEHKPIFILGSGRSGTSAMTGALKVSGIAGFHEGHVFPLMNEMAQRIWTLALWDKADAASLNTRADTVKLVVKTCFDQTYGDIGSQTWLDKTADHLMIHCVPFLAAMFPHARFLSLTRHPIAVAESRRRKFGETPYFSMLEWKKCVIAWNQHKHLLNPSNYIECDARELRCKHLHLQVSTFLRFDAPSSSTLSDYLATQSPEMTRQAPLDNFQACYASLNDHRTSDFKALMLMLLETLEIHIEDTDWSEGTIAWVKRFLGALPEQCGYTLYRPKNMLLDITANFVKLMDEQSSIVKINEKSIAALQEKYATQLANANYWKEQHDCQLANANKWKTQCENAPLFKPEKTYRKWINGILNRH